jgi:hypothetical protein
MTEILQKAPHDIERQMLQNRLATIDRNPRRLQNFIAELYARETSRPDNPQILYAAATYLTALTYLDHRNTVEEQPELPDRAAAERAFSTYTRLLSMLSQESNSPRYYNDDRVRRRLVGTREELAIHATLTYATTQGEDFVILPSPAAVDFVGETSASDMQLFFPGHAAETKEIQVKFNLEENGGEYDPHIIVLNLAQALGSSKRAGTLRGLLKDIGGRDDSEDGELHLNEREHDIIMDGAAAILEEVGRQAREA